MGAVDQATALHDPYASGRHQVERQRVDTVLDREHTGGQRLGGVVVAYRHGALDDDRARNHLGDDEVHAGAVNLDAGGDRARVRVEPLEGGQQRRVNVE